MENKLITDEAPDLCTESTQDLDTSLKNSSSDSDQALMSMNSLQMTLPLVDIEHSAKSPQKDTHSAHNSPDALHDSTVRLAENEDCKDDNFTTEKTDREDEEQTLMEENEERKEKDFVTKMSEKNNPKDEVESIMEKTETCKETVFTTKISEKTDREDEAKSVLKEKEACNKMDSTTKISKKTGPMDVTKSSKTSKTKRSDKAATQTQVSGEGTFHACAKDPGACRKFIENLIEVSRIALDLIFIASDIPNSSTPDSETGEQSTQSSQQKIDVNRMRLKIANEIAHEDFQRMYDQWLSPKLEQPVGRIEPNPSIMDNMVNELDNANLVTTEIIDDITASHQISVGTLNAIKILPLWKSPCRKVAGIVEEMQQPNIEQCDLLLEEFRVAIDGYKACYGGWQAYLRQGKSLRDFFAQHYANCPSRACKCAIVREFKTQRQALLNKMMQLGNGQNNDNRFVRVCSDIQNFMTNAKAQCVCILNAIRQSVSNE